MAIVSMDFTVIVELTSMTDPKLEEEISLLRKCMAMLRHFHDIFDNAIVTEAVVPEDEGSIQELRESVPKQWTLAHRQLSLGDDDAVDTLVRMASSLPAIITLTDFQKRKLYALWHKAYMKLHYLLGKLQYRKEMLESFHPGRLKAKKFLIGPVVVIIVALVVLLVYIVLRAVSAGEEATFLRLFDGENACFVQ